MKHRKLYIWLLASCCLFGCRGQESRSESSAVVPAAATTTVGTTTTVATTSSSTAASTTTTTTTPETTTTTTVLSTTAPPISLQVRETLAVYDSVYLRDCILSKDVTLQHPEERVPTDTVGPCTMSVSFLYQGMLYQQTISYTVVDQTPPLLLNGGYQTVIQQGKAFSIQDHVGYADNYDRHPALSYTGTVQTDVIGKYPLRATVTDASGNQTSWDMTVSVVAQIPATVDNNPRLSFDAFQAKYGGGGKELGIDVSKWQGAIDFAAVRQAGCTFVIMRIGHSRNGIAMDEYFTRNLAAAKNAGLRVGVYFYSTANSLERVREEAQWIAKQLGGQTLDFPVAFDWESFTRFQQYGMSIYDLNQNYRAFYAEMGRLGYSAMLYSSKSYLQSFWDTTAPGAVWLAHYTQQTDYAGRYSIWQMSCRGRIAGIAGDVDLDIYDPSVPLFG